MSEKQRLDFIIERDGLAEAVAFAKRTMVIYRKCVLQSQKKLNATPKHLRKFDKPHYASFREFRRKFIQSYCDFKRFVGANHHNSGASTQLLQKMQQLPKVQTI